MWFVCVLLGYFMNYSLGKQLKIFKTFLVRVAVQHHDFALPSVLTACYSILQNDKICYIRSVEPQAPLI